MSIKCIEFREINKGALIGFAKLELPSGIIINDCQMCESNASRWVSPPSRMMRDSTDQPVVKEGKTQYIPIISFKDRATRDAWSKAALKATDDFLLESSKATRANSDKPLPSSANPFDDDIQF